MAPVLASPAQPCTPGPRRLLCTDTPNSRPWLCPPPGTPEPGLRGAHSVSAQQGPIGNSGSSLFCQLRRLHSTAPSTPRPQGPRIPPRPLLRHPSPAATSLDDTVMVTSRRQARFSPPRPRQPPGRASRQTRAAALRRIPGVKSSPCSRPPSPRASLTPFFLQLLSTHIPLDPAPGPLNLLFPLPPRCRTSAPMLRASFSFLLLTALSAPLPTPSNGLVCPFPCSWPLLPTQGSWGQALDHLSLCVPRASPRAWHVVGAGWVHAG